MIFTRESWCLVPEAPTLKGTPFGELEDFSNDRVIAGPPNLPDEIAHILERSLLRALRDPELQEWSRSSHNPLFIRNADVTLDSIHKKLAFVDKYQDYFEE